MAYTDIPSGDKDPDSPITTSLINLLDNNVDGVAAGDSGAPSIQEAAIAASAISQGKLKTAQGEVSTGANSYVVTLPGGEYGFFPNMRENSTGYGQAEFTDPINGYVRGATYLCSIWIAEVGTGTMYMNQRYIQASPPYDLGDGEIPLFIFATIINATGEISGMYIAPEAPWHNNGPTNIRSNRRDLTTGRSWKKCCRAQLEKQENNIDIKALLMDPLTKDQALEILADKNQYEIEITQAMKQADMPIIPHPFTANDLTGQTVVMLDPVSPVTEQLFNLQQAGESIAEIINDGYITHGNSQIARVTPDQVMCVDLGWKNTKV